MSTCCHNCGAARNSTPSGKAASMSMMVLSGSDKAGRHAHQRLAALHDRAANAAHRRGAANQGRGHEHAAWLHRLAANAYDEDDDDELCPRCGGLLDESGHCRQCGFQVENARGYNPDDESDDLDHGLDLQDAEGGADDDDDDDDDAGAYGRAEGSNAGSSGRGSYQAGGERATGHKVGRGGTSEPVGNRRARARALPLPALCTNSAYDAYTPSPASYQATGAEGQYGRAPRVIKSAAELLAGSPDGSEDPEGLPEPHTIEEILARESRRNDTGTDGGDDNDIRDEPARVSRWRSQAERSMEGDSNRKRMWAAANSRHLPIPTLNWSDAEDPRACRRPARRRAAPVVNAATENPWAARPDLELK
jgi:hypothetical protein